MVVIFKIILVPLIIAVITLAGRVWGAQVSGFLAGLPVIAGPILVFIALEQGIPFAVSSAEASLLGVASLGLFCLAYAWVSVHHGVLVSLSAGIAAFAAMTTVSIVFHPSPGIALIFVVFALFVMRAVFPPLEEPIVPVSSTPQEIGFRMLAAAALVLVITMCASQMGPRLSGLLAPFPVAGTVLASFTHNNFGAPSARRLLRGFVGGLFGMAAFAFVMSVGLSSYGVTATVMCAVVCALISGNISLLPSRLMRLKGR